MIKEEPKYTILKITLKEGRNRQIRRIVNQFGHKVIDLQRINFANISLNNLDSVIPGFDLASAYLNQESIEMKIKINCLDDQQIFFVENKIFLNKDIPFNSYKINLNEWFKTPQEL